VSAARVSIRCAQRLAWTAEPPPGRRQLAAAQSAGMRPQAVLRRCTPGVTGGGVRAGQRPWQPRRPAR
jgi:hypothetical protein